MGTPSPLSTPRRLQCLILEAFPLLLFYKMTTATGLHMLASYNCACYTKSQHFFTVYPQLACVYYNLCALMYTVITHMFTATFLSVYSFFYVYATFDNILIKQMLLMMTCIETRRLPTCIFATRILLVAREGHQCDIKGKCDILIL